MPARILCVEDEEALREDLAEELGEAGYEVAVAGDGQAALAMILDLKPDLVLCDVSMPVMDGPTLLTGC